MIFSLDRIENGVAVLIDENSNSRLVDAKELECLEEGSLYEEVRGKLKYNAALTEKRRKRLAERTKKMFE
ncbi:MAG: DUF3006 domain-containing protein [Ruminococcus sp.]|nr:DUF3006 domain-containing protein [Ruminococcus sp.]